MTTNSPRSGPESASSTIDSDAQARRANDGELSAGLQSDLTIDEDAMDGRLTAEEPANGATRTSPSTARSCTRSIAGSPPNRPPCADSPRWSRAALNLWRYLARWPRRCADACPRTPPDCGASKRMARLRIVAAAAHPAALARMAGGHANSGGRHHHRGAGATQRAGPHGSTATTTLPGRSPLACARWACAAAVGVPIIVDGRVWGLAAVGSLQPGPMPADTEVRISRFAELISTALVAGYRDEQKRQLLAEASQRLSLVDALLEGRAFDEWSLREVAGSLRLPINGPFVVVSAQVPAVGDEPLREIESKLRSLDIFSVWRLLPDVQVGIVHVKSKRKLDRVVALLSRTTTARVGVSAAFRDLRDTPQALHVARMMLRGRPDSTSSVAMFDGSILATAAVSAPQAMIKRSALR